MTELRHMSFPVTQKKGTVPYLLKVDEKTEAGEVFKVLIKDPEGNVVGTAELPINDTSLGLLSYDANYNIDGRVRTVYKDEDGVIRANLVQVTEDGLDYTDLPITAANSGLWQASYDGTLILLTGGSTVFGFLADVDGEIKVPFTATGNFPSNFNTPYLVAPNAQFFMFMMTPYGQLPYLHFYGKTGDTTFEERPNQPKLFNFTVPYAMSAVEISPDSTRIAYAQKQEGIKFVIATVDTNGYVPGIVNDYSVQITPDNNLSPRLVWLDNDHLAVLACVPGEIVHVAIYNVTQAGVVTLLADQAASVPFYPATPFSIHAKPTPGVADSFRVVAIGPTIYDRGVLDITKAAGITATPVPVIAGVSLESAVLTPSGNRILVTDSSYRTYLYEININGTMTLIP